ncbi:hypothetical protein N7540_004220 [Penicillium herquei]|nr:hypothetical protein N7540_004220 [Penicillium herquei]
MDLIRWLLDKGADLNQRCQEYMDRTTLSVAIEEAPWSIIELLLNHGGSLQAGQLMHYAALRQLDDRLDVIQFLIDRGLEVNMITYQDCGDEYYFNLYSGIGSPLHYAAGRGLLDSVKLLVQNGATPRIKDPIGKTPADWAKNSGHTTIFDFLQPLTIGSDPEGFVQFTDGPGRHFRPPTLDEFLATIGIQLIE